MLWTKDEILKSAEIHRDEIIKIWNPLVNNKQPRGRKFSTTSPFDLLLMFLSILEKKPSHAIEFSPWMGYSSSVIALAMKCLGQKNSFVTFEKEKSLDPFIQERFKTCDIQDYAKVIYGDAIPTIKKFVHNNPEWEVGFCFSDCFHRKEFSRQYTKEIFPLLSSGCIIFVHDVSSNEKGGIETSSPSPANEHEGIQEWVNQVNPQYMLTHKMFGGQVERSKNLPRDTKFFDELAQILGRDILKHEESAPVCFVCLNP